MADIVKKAKTTPKPRKTATKNEKVVQGSKPAKPSREEIARLAKSYWTARGCKDGYAEQDWARAEKELLKMAT